MGEGIALSFADLNLEISQDGIESSRSDPISGFDATRIAMDSIV